MYDDAGLGRLKLNRTWRLERAGTYTPVKVPDNGTPPWERSKTAPSNISSLMAMYVMSKYDPANGLLIVMVMLVGEGAMSTGISTLSTLKLLSKLLKSKATPTYK